MCRLKNGFRVGRRGKSIVVPFPSLHTHLLALANLALKRSRTHLVWCGIQKSTTSTPITPFTRPPTTPNVANIQPPLRPRLSGYIGTPPKNPRYSTPLFWTLFQNLQSLKRQYDFRITLRIPTPFSRSSTTSFPMVYPIFNLADQLVMG